MSRAPRRASSLTVSRWLSIEEHLSECVLQLDMSQCFSETRHLTTLQLFQRLSYPESWSLLSGGATHIATFHCLAGTVSSTGSSSSPPTDRCTSERMSPKILSSFRLFSSKLTMAKAAFSSAVYTCTNSPPMNTLCHDAAVHGKTCIIPSNKAAILDCFSCMLRPAEACWYNEHTGEQGLTCRVDKLLTRSSSGH